MNTEPKDIDSSHSHLAGRKLVLGVTGGIAAYKAVELARLLVKADAIVYPVLTPAAEKFITPMTFAALTGEQVSMDLWEADMPHIKLSRKCDAIVIAPASADFLAKIAHGLADDLLSALSLARECPLIVAPAMNQAMWANPATLRNLSILKQDGVHIIGPASGEQACGETGFGRMEEPQIIAQALAQLWAPEEEKILRGQKVVITAGPTFEAWDAMRGLTNLSSGKMGYALAEAAKAAGAEVVLVSGPVSLPAPVGVTRVQVKSALQMREQVFAHLQGCQLFIAVAAVADFRPAKMETRKIKRVAGETFVLELIANPDILAEVAALPTPPFCVGFAAESHDLEAYAKDKRVRKAVPLIIANLIENSLGQDEAQMMAVDKNGVHPWPMAKKSVVAWRILRHIEGLRSTTGLV